MEPSNTVITRETITRLVKDVKQIIKCPLTDNGIYYVHDDEDLLKGYAMIIGPKDTPYFGGYYFFEFHFPYNYPFSPPVVKYKTNDGKTRFNPNLYKCGKVCLSILNTWSGDKWSSCQTISSILLTLCSILNEEPYLNEPGQNKSSSDFIPYQKSIEYSNINFAICDIIMNFNKLIPNKFFVFFPFIKETFLANFDKIYSFVENKNNINETLYVSLFSMQTHINYELLRVKLLDVKNIISQT
jgi:ubiquitin-conjugating enzyme E2 Z